MKDLNKRSQSGRRGFKLCWESAKLHILCLGAKEAAVLLCSLPAVLSQQNDKKQQRVPSLRATHPENCCFSGCREVIWWQLVTGSCLQPIWGVMLSPVKSISTFIMTYPFSLGNGPQPGVHLPPHKKHTQTQSCFFKLGTRELSWKDFGELVQSSCHSPDLSSNFTKHSAGLTHLVRVLAYNLH